jgi:hypothetical protein
VLAYGSLVITCSASRANGAAPGVPKPYNGT